MELWVSQISLKGGVLWYFDQSVGSVLENLLCPASKPGAVLHSVKEYEMKKTGLILVALLGSQLAIAQNYTTHSAEGTLPMAAPETGTTTNGSGMKTSAHSIFSYNHSAEGTLPLAMSETGKTSGGGMMTASYSGPNHNHSPEGTLPYAVPDTNRGGLMNASYSKPHYFVHPGDGTLPESTGYISTDVSVWH